jgi:hypothetical protein
MYDRLHIRDLQIGKPAGHGDQKHDSAETCKKFSGDCEAHVSPWYKTALN